VLCLSSWKLFIIFVLISKVDFRFEYLSLIMYLNIINTITNELIHITFMYTLTFRYGDVTC